MAAKNLTINVDFSNVKESSGFNPKHQEDGDYLMKISDAEITKSKAGDPMVVFAFQDVNMRSAVYPYYCPMTENSLWKIRTLLINLGLPVPKSKGKINLAATIGKMIGVGLEEDEYEGKMKSTIVNTFPADEIDPVEDVEEEDFDGEAEDEDDEEEAPAPVKKAKAKPAPVEEDDEDDEEEEAPAPVKKKRKAAPVVEEDDDEDEEEEEAPKVSKRTAARRAAKAAAVVEEDEDEEDEIEEAPVKKTKKKAAPVEEDEDDDDLDLDIDDV